MYSKYIVMASKEEFTAAVAFALSCVKQTYLVLSRRKFSVFTRAVTCSYGSLLATVSYQLLPYMFGVKVSRTSAPPSKRIIYSAFFIRILIDAFTVCYTVRYPAYFGACAQIHVP